MEGQENTEEILHSPENHVDEMQHRSEKAERTLAYFRDMDNPEYDDIEKDIMSTGLSIPEFKKEFVISVDSMSGPDSESIAGLMPLEESYNNIYDFRNSVWDDFSTHFQDGMNRVAYGLGTVVPGTVAAFNESDDSPEWVNDWVESVGEWYDDTKERTSVASNESFFETGSLRSFMGGMGSGLASMAPMVLALIPYVGQAAYLGTTFSDVFGSILKTGKDNGLSLEDSARMAMITSIPVTALERIGMKGVTRPVAKGVVNSLMKGTFDNGIKKIAKQGFTREALEDFTKVGLKEMSTKDFAKKKSLQIAKAFGEGSLSEGVTETLQSVVEQVGQQIFDTYKDEDTKGHFGTDIRSKDFWMQAAEEGFYGAVLGGVMAGGGASSNGIKEQSTYHYVRSSLEKGKPENISSLKNYVSKLHSNGSLSKSDYNSYLSTVDKMVDVQNRLWHKLDSPSAKYQSYNNLMIKDNVESIESSEWYGSLDKDFPEKKSEIQSLVTDVKKDVSSIINSIISEDEISTEENKDYNFNPINQEELVPELSSNLDKLNNLIPNDLKINKIFNQQASNEGKIQSIKDEKLNNVEKENINSDVNFGERYKTEEGIVLTELSLKDKSDVIKSVNIALSKDEDGKNQILKNIENDYGINKDAINYLIKNQDIKSSDLEVIESQTNLNEINDQKSTPIYKLQNEIKEDYGVDVIFNDDNTFSNPTTEIKGFGGTQAVNDVISKLESLGYSKFEDIKSNEDLSNKNNNLEVNDEVEEKLSDKKEIKNETTNDSSIDEKSEEKKPIKVQEKESVKKEPKSEEKNVDSEINNQNNDDNLTKEKIDDELKSDSIDDYRKNFLIKKKKDISQAEELISSFSGLNSISKDQRVNYGDYNNLIGSNPILYSNIKNHLKKIFPNIPLNEVDSLGSKYGSKVLARIVESGIEIDKNSAIQSSIIHEYSHVYLDMLGLNNPLVNVGKKIIENSDFYLDAKNLYPDKNKNEQLDEALTEALAQKSLEKLRVKFEGSSFDKFLEFSKRFWIKIKSKLGLINKKDYLDILSEGLVEKHSPYTIGLGDLSGINKDQRNSIVDKKILKTIDVVNSGLIIHRLNSIKSESNNFNHNDISDVSKIAFNSLLQRYIQEKSGLIKDIESKIFEDVDFNIESPVGLGSFEYLRLLKSFAEKVKNNIPSVYSAVNKVSNTMHKIELDIDSIGNIDEETTQDLDSKLESSNNEIKASKKINSSVRSILSTIVDLDGSKINEDFIYQYVSDIAQKTHKKSGFLKRLEIDAKSELIPMRILSILNMLSEDQKQGVLKTMSSLIQVKSEGVFIEKVQDKNGEISYKLRNPIKNKDKTLGGIENNFESWKGSDSALAFSNLYSRGYLDLIKKRDNQALSYISENLSKLFGVNINSNNIGDIIDSFPKNSKSKEENFFNAIAGRYDSFDSYFQGSNKYGSEVKWKNINGFVQKIFEAATDKSMLENTYLNGAGNTVSTTQTGYWISELNSMLLNGDRMSIMKKSPIYKNNSVLKFFDKRNDVKYSKSDSIKNFNTNENVEYSNMSKEDYHLLQLHKFATNNSKSYYSQTLGVLSNRDGMLLFETPTYSDSDLKNEYKIQADGLQNQLNNILNSSDPSKKNKIINDFNNLYIHQSDFNGKVKNGIDIDYSKEIKEIKNLLIKNNLSDAYSKIKVGKGKPFSSLDDMIKNYFYTEALNRIYLNDIYGGTSILHTNSKKGAVESSVKRMSGPNSNGELNEIDKPITFIIHKGTSSDSFNINGSHLSDHIKKDSGSLDPVGINSKDQIYQIDPFNGSSLYVKNSSLNLERNNLGHNLNSFGGGFNDAANIVLKIEDYIESKTGEKPYIKFLDQDAMKGTFSDFESIDFNEISEKVNNGDIESLIPKFANVDIVNHRTLFNLNKTLKDPSKQTSILSTQAALIQFNTSNKEDIDSFEKTALRYLKNSMSPNDQLKDFDYERSKVFRDLMNFDNVINELTEDLNDREKSSTTEILESIKKYNEDNVSNKIDSFDHPSLKLIYEQFASSKLSKKSIKIELPGNFMHQLPDMDSNEKTKLKHNEIAVSYKMFANSMEEANSFIGSEVAVVRIPASAEMSMFAGKVKYFLDTDANVVTLSDEFVRVSDSDHDGDKAMVYRKEIRSDGKFDEYSSKTSLFNKFYENLNKDQFIKNSLTNTLSLDPIKDGSKLNYSTKSINDVVDVATKMGLGQKATGRFAIASKLMSLLSQSNEKLKDPIYFNGKKLQDFTNKSLDSIAILLQAALDIGNDPVLTTTGFNETTIDVGNSMLLLGLDVKEVKDFLKSKEISKLSSDYESYNSSFSDKNKTPFSKFFNDYKEKNNNDIINQFNDFKEISDGLSKLITFVQLDKSLPNNSSLNNNLIDSIKDFDSLPFTISNLKNRSLYSHREKILNLQKKVYSNSLLSSNDLIQNISRSISDQTINKFEFNKRSNEQIMHYLSQNQLSKKRNNVSKWINDFSKRMNVIYDNIILGKSVELPSHIEDIFNSLTTKGREESYNYYLKYTTKEKLDNELKSYENIIKDLNTSEKLKGNSFFDFLEFKPDDIDNGKVVMRLNPKFKATSDSLQKFKSDFNKIKDIDLNLYKDIIDYQLYRFGVNNKIGSFIDGLPMDININLLKNTSKLKNNNDLIDSLKGEIGNNLILANKDLIKKVYFNEIKKVNSDGSLSLKDSSISLINYNNNIYRKSNGVFSKIGSGSFESNSNFTSYNISKFRTSIVSKEDINNLKKNCK